MHGMHTEHNELRGLYWFGPPESKTLRPVVGVDCLRDCARVELHLRLTSSALYSLTDKVG
jgi:hypothetical protein